MMNFDVNRGKVKDSKKKKIAMQFKKMMEKLYKKGFYSKKGFLITSIAVWYPEKKNDTDYRFRMIPKIYKIVEEYFDEKLAPFVMEALYTMDAWCYRRQYDNLIGLLIVDFATPQASGAIDDMEEKELVRDKLEIMYLAFKIVCEINPIASGIEQKEINQDYTDIYSIALQLHGVGKNNQLGQVQGEDNEKIFIDCMKYFTQIIEPLMKEIIAEGAMSDYFQGIHWKIQPGFSKEEIEIVENKLVVCDDLNPIIVHFLIENILEYVINSDGRCYNPFWIFGSANYKKLIQRVWKYDYKN